jgi:hypothetical protein
MPTRPLPTTPAPTVPKGLPVSVDTIVQTAFKRVDLNNDGSISRTELLGSLGPAGKMPLASLMVGHVIKGLDTSGDGSISRAEFSTFLNKLDTNLDASLSASEIHKAGVGLIGVLGLMGPHHGG